jgi:hypothetical protein
MRISGLAWRRLARIDGSTGLGRGTINHVSFHSRLNAGLPSIARGRYNRDVATSEAGNQPRTFYPLIRWAAFTGAALLVMRRLMYATFPNFLPSSAWRPESWWAGVLINAVFELILLMFLLGVPFGIYFFRLRYTSARDLLIDCAAAMSLYLTALFLL